MDRAMEWLKARPFAYIMVVLFACIIVLNVYNRWVN
jgi:hypothetical protein